MLECDRLRVEFVRKGARMVSLFDKYSDREFLLQGREDPGLDCFDQDYPACNPAGFDDMFPTINACFYKDFPWKGVQAADHGEVWSLEWKTEITNNALAMTVDGIRFPYHLEKRVFFCDDLTLHIDYTLTNKAPYDFKFLWTAHPILAIEQNTCFLLPEACQTGYTIACDCGRLGRYGDLFNLDCVLGSERPDGKLVIEASDASRNCSEKFYVREPLSEGFCSVVYPGGTDRLNFRFPVDSVPYLGLLITENENGSWAIVEPATAPYDQIDLADSYGKASVVKALSEYKWFLEIDVSEGVKGR